MDRVDWEGAILRILCERLEYLYGILTITPISQQETADQIADYLLRESQLGQLTASSMGRCIEEFLKYLKLQHAQLSRAYPEFGGDRTGATFVIGQIESALRFFKDPHAASPRQLNLLDE